MQQQAPLFSRNVIIAIVLSIGILFGWSYLQRVLFPPPPVKPIPFQECFGLVGGGPFMGLSETTLVPDPKENVALIAGSPMVAIDDAFMAKNPRLRPMEKPPEKKQEPTSDLELALQQIASGSIRSFDKGELIGMHTEGASHLQVVLNSKGGSVQQVILPHFQSTSRLGLEERNSDGSKRPLFLIPGLRQKRTIALDDQEKMEALEPIIMLPSGRVPPNLQYRLDDPCYVMYHYEAENDDRPVDTLGRRIWNIKEKQVGRELEEQKVVFETDLGAPYYVTIEKTFTLKRDEYHIGLKVNIIPQPLPKDIKSREPLRYQITSAHSLPLEGEWYTSTHHVAMTGYVDRGGSGSRSYEDARSIHHTGGGDRLMKTDRKSIQWTGVAVQYFASVLAVDDQQSKRNFLEFTRATPVNPMPNVDLRSRVDAEGNPIPIQIPIDKTKHDFPFLIDATTRAITEKFTLLDPKTNQPAPVTHAYLLYQGPVKVNLLKSLTKETAVGKELRENYPSVSDDLVNRYIEKLNLDTLTDAPMPNALGRFANSIYWTDIVIGFTNLIHWLLGILYAIIPNLGICIVLITLMVRGMLFPLSRKQAINGQIMSQRMAKVSPELRKIKEKYKNDFMKMREETMKLYREHNINPAAMLGGCLTLLIQMPIFMGLYYALQESIFFRLEEFLWMPNLSAPDMLAWWSEMIPWVSTPNDMGGMLYLGPYFNILPLIAVGLMLYQQKKMMPVSEDPQIQSQQKMMKYMLILMALFFYKVAAGLCIYFTISTAWGIMERRMTPKVKLDEKTGQPQGNTITPTSAKSDAASTNGVRGKMRTWWNNLLEQAENKRELGRGSSNPEPEQQQPPRGGKPPNQDKKGKKKKKR